uniref:Uncharacterized protein n=1 Tax=Ditylenchus dipsaci TaxID=166011 RepID=A0A915DNR5_9BILA
MYAVLVDKPVDQKENLISNPTTIIYSKSGPLRREFKSFEDLLTLHEKQSVAFLHISIYKKDMDMQEVQEKHFLLSTRCPIDIPGFFFNQQRVYEAVPEFQLPQFSLYSNYKINFEVFYSRAVELEYPSENYSLCHLPSRNLLIWLESNNAGKNYEHPKLYKSNYYRFVQPLDIFVETFFEDFQHQSKPCQYEVVVADLQDIQVPACKINKIAKNYVTNEVMESILLKDSPDDQLRKKSQLFFTAQINSQPCTGALCQCCNSTCSINCCHTRSLVLPPVRDLSCFSNKDCDDTETCMVPIHSRNIIGKLRGHCVHLDI